MIMKIIAAVLLVLVLGWALFYFLKVEPEAMEAMIKDAFAKGRLMGYLEGFMDGLGVEDEEEEDDDGRTESGLA